MLSTYSGDKILNLFSRYAKNRNNQIFKLINKSLKKFPDVKRILEFGAGKGEFINRFKTGRGMETLAVESDASYRQILSKNHATFERLVDVTFNPDFLFMIDVLEHMEEDEILLRQLHDKLKIGGGLFIYVPARMELYSAFDKSIGHYRRYSKLELMEKVKRAGFSIEDCRYHEMLGYAASAIHNKLIGIKEPGAFSILLYDYCFVPLTTLIEKLINPPIGKSLYLLAKVEKK
jgi:SAM-dependent methyltransferase